MEFTALEPWKLTALMLVGGVFALAGLWLIFKPKSDGHSMMIHVAGMKLEASSAGVLVFLIGAALFATPLFVPERSDRLSPIPKRTSGSFKEETRAVALPAGAQGGEQEPNNRIVEANQIRRGIFYSGATRQGSGDDEDWYVVPTDDIRGKNITFQIRTISREPYEGKCASQYFHETEERVNSRWLEEPGNTLVHTVHVGQSAHMFVRVASAQGNPVCTYEIRAL